MRSAGHTPVTGDINDIAREGFPVAPELEAQGAEDPIHFRELDSLLDPSPTPAF